MYIPGNSGDTPSHNLPQGDTYSVSLYIFHIDFWIDNIPTNPLKVWDHRFTLNPAMHKLPGVGGGYPLPLHIFSGFLDRRVMCLMHPLE